MLSHYSASRNNDRLCRSMNCSVQPSTESIPDSGLRLNGEFYQSLDDIRSRVLWECSILIYEIKTFSMM
jgi:hypothetical protein